MNISAFVIGISTAFFAIFALHILCWRRHRTRFQTVLGSIMAIWAVWCAKDLIITFPGMYTQRVLDWVFIVDSWSAISYTVFIFEAVKPGWTTWRRLLLLSLPFVLFTVAYALWMQREVIYVYALFLWFYAWTVVIVGYADMKRYLRYIRSEYSNIDKIDVSWLRPVFLFAIVSQLAWIATSLYATVAGDIAYYACVILLWLMVLHYSWDFRPIKQTLPNPSDVGRDSSKDEDAAEGHITHLSTREGQKGEPSVEGYLSALPEGKLEQLMDEQKFYLNKNLTVHDLALAVGTNRTYLSNYLSQVRGQTFYDYINHLRIERASLPMMREHPEYKLEHIAMESGFASISTFRRAFIKFTGQTPGQYEAEENAQS